MSTLTEQAPVRLPVKESKNLEGQIQNREKILGIESDFDRLIEASLFIDKKFLSYAVITGIVDKPERIFGASAWADYLDGRIYAKDNLGRELDIDFIIDLHKRLTARSNPHLSGKIREHGVIGGSYDEGKPVTYSPEQVKAIEENPPLKFARPDDDPDGTTGYIVYPHDGKNVQEHVRRDLGEICEWFNKQQYDGIHDHYTFAAQLERKLISLHPFADANGTLARVLMNWALQSAEADPAILEDPGADILSSGEAWEKQVVEGCQRFFDYTRKARSLKEAGIDVDSALFGLGQDKAFYDYIFRHLSQAPKLPTNGDKHNHLVYEKFLEDFRAEMDRFQEYMHSTTTISTTKGTRDASQGGLISPETVELMAARGNIGMSEELKKLFFADIEAYRGGIVDGEIDDEKICKLFVTYSGVGTGYRALKGASVSPTSTRSVNPKLITESLDYYNKIFAAAYFKKLHPNKTSPYSDVTVEDLETTVRQHVAGADTIWNSPFVSTSLDFTVSRNWARSFGASYAKDANFGVLIKAQIPREGAIMTFTKGLKGVNVAGFGFEREILVAGGIPPSAIKGIEIYAKSGSVGSPAFTAERVVADGEHRVVVSDRRGEFVVVRTYKYVGVGMPFEFEGEELTDSPSTRELEVPDLAHDIQIGSYVDQLMGKYYSPFKDKEFLSKNIISDIYLNDNLILKNNFSKDIYNFNNKIDTISNINKIYKILKKENMKKDWD